MRGFEEMWAGKRWSGGEFMGMYGGRRDRGLEHERRGLLVVGYWALNLVGLSMSMNLFSDGQMV